MKSYLYNRKQFVQIGEHSIENLTCNYKACHKVPSLALFSLISLSTTFFLASQKFNSTLYADDTTLNSFLDCFGNGEDEIQISITTELQKIFKWLDVNKLCLNTAKSKYMLFHMPQKIHPELSFSFSGIPIKNVKELNFLGLIIDANLNLKARLNTIGVKIARKLKYIFLTHAYTAFYI